MRETHLLLAVVLLSLPLLAQSQDEVITGFQANGLLSWTNTHSNGEFSVQWASSAEGPWRWNWMGLLHIPATGTTVAASVPMLYRIMWNADAACDISTTPSETTLSSDGDMVVITVTGGSGSYTWSVTDVAIGDIVPPATGNAVLYKRYQGGDNAVRVDSGPCCAFTLIHQPPM